MVWSRKLSKGGFNDRTNILLFISYETRKKNEKQGIGEENSGLAEIQENNIRKVSQYV